MLFVKRLSRHSQSSAQLSRSGTSGSSGLVKSGSQSSLNISNSQEAEQKKKPKTIDCTVPKDYHLNRRVVIRSLEALDSQDYPDRPSQMQESTLHHAIERFDRVFANGQTEQRARQRKEQVDSVIQHLRRHTRRRRGDSIIQEGFIEWEQTSRIYELFSVQLNIFERIFFTVDIGETTSFLSRLCSFFFMIMIFLSILVWMISTLPGFGMEIPADCVGVSRGDCQPEPREVFKVIERICVYVFTVEYFIRIATVHSVRFALLDEMFLQAVLTGTTVQVVRSACTMSEVFATQGAAINKQDMTAKFGNDEKLDSKLWTLIKYVFSPANIIDLLAIFPYWLEVFSGEDGNGGMLMVLRVLRLTRVFKVFKIGKYSEVFSLFNRVVSQSTPALSLMLFFIGLGCCLFGTLIWFAEQGTWYPEGHWRLIHLNITGRGAYLRHDGGEDEDAYEETPFLSIVHSFWYVIVTITTVGYGDMYPTTVWGKLVGTLTILNGIIVLAMPIGVLGANFSQEYHRVLDESRRRHRLKHQLDTLAAAEEEQDAALNALAAFEEKLGVECSSPISVEIHQINGMRQRILAEAELLDSRWQHVLPSMSYQQLSRSLRRFVNDFLDGSPPDETSLRKSFASTSGQVAFRPVISKSRLMDLDALSVQVHQLLASTTSVDHLADFSLREALACRRQWAMFTDRCWEYLVTSCRVDISPDTPQLGELKACLTRCDSDREEEVPRTKSQRLTKKAVDRLQMTISNLVGQPERPGSEESGDPSVESMPEPF